MTTDFGQIEDVIQDKIGLNRAKARVAADLSSEGLVDIKREEAMEKAMADQALRDFEVQMGMVTPETANVVGSHEGTRAGDQSEGDRRVADSSNELAAKTSSTPSEFETFESQLY